MKIFFLSFVILSTICGLNAHCVRQPAGGTCEERVFPEPEPKEIHYIYHGESCDCPKYHDTIVEKPVVAAKKAQSLSYEYDIEVAQKQNDDVKRYLFDVRVEKPIERAPERSSDSYNYELQAPAKDQKESSVRYIFDGRVEQPVKPCQQKPWQGLVSQVDRVLMPSRDCQNADHTPENCNCGCRNPSHTPKSCTCGSNSYKLPIIYNSRYDTQAGDSQNVPIFTFPDSMSLPSGYEISSSKVKREASPEKKLKSKRREIKFPKLKPLKKFSSKDFKSIKTLESVQKPKLSSKRSKSAMRQSRPKRKPDSQCGYTYESCDPKKHNRDGCPLCYKCKCEPVTKPRENEKFSPYDIKVPYKFVTHDEAPGTAPINQEFDNEPAPYTGLRDQEMYRKYIQQVVSKYPEHMSRKMPDIQEQQRDLMKFVDELAKSNKSPGSKVVENEDVRYKMMDDAMGMYKYYEKAIGSMPKSPLEKKEGKFFKKRGTVLEVIELDPNDFDASAFKIGSKAIKENLSESQ